jgi:calmodulin/calcium-binding protein CML
LGEDPEADLRDAFAVLDDDDDGFIDVTELGRAAQRSGGFDPEEAQSIVRAVDTDGDGRLSFAEFVRYMTKAD